MIRKLLILIGLCFLASTAHAQCSGSGAAFSCAAGSTPAQIQAAINSAGTATTITLQPGNYGFNAHFDLMADPAGVSLVCATAPPTQGAAISNACTVTVTSWFSIGQVNNLPAGGTNNNLFRISGFQFLNPSFNTTLFWIESSCGHYGTACTGTLSKFRFDHNTIDQSGESVMVYISDIFSYVQVYGVIDHNILKSTSANWGGSAGDGGLLQWVGGTNPVDGPSQLGTANNLFVENNTVDFSSSGVTDNGGFGIIDSWGGAAIVARYNTSVDGLWTAHAVTHGGGYNNLEFYNNSVSVDAGAVAEGFQDCYRCFHSQGATTNIFFNNLLTSYSGHSNSPLELTSYREYAYGAGGTPGGAGASVDGSFPACDGTQSEDGNRSPTSTWYGYPCWHQPGRAPNGVYMPTYAWNNAWSDGTAFVNNGGNSFGTFGGTPPPSCTPQPAGTCEYWDLHMVANRDFYEPVSPNSQSNATTPFNGTTGMGFGTLANRPTTCTTSSESSLGAGQAGVGYFATDVGPLGTLYTCSATNVWTIYYVPYTYPHPLVGGGGGGGGTPVFSPSATSLVFGGTDPGADSFLSVTITNTGTGTLTFVRPIPNPTGGAFYIYANGCAGAGSLAPSASCMITIGLTVTNPGPYSSTLIISDNTSNSPHDIALSGTGINIGTPMSPIASLTEALNEEASSSALVSVGAVQPASF